MPITGCNTVYGSTPPNNPHPYPWINSLFQDGVTEKEFFVMTHMTDTLMTDREVRELPKAWAIIGDGGMGDIGYQNVSKVRTPARACRREPEADRKLEHK